MTYETGVNRKEVFESLSIPGVKGIMVSRFLNMTAAFVFKDRNKTLELPGDMKASTKDRRTDQGVMKMLMKFVKVPQYYSNLIVQTKESEEMPDFEVVCNELADCTTQELLTQHANAKKARKLSRCTPMQQAILTYYSELEEYVK